MFMFPIIPSHDAWLRLLFAGPVEIEQIPPDIAVGLRLGMPVVYELTRQASAQQIRDGLEAYEASYLDSLGMHASTEGQAAGREVVRWTEIAQLAGPDAEEAAAHRIALARAHTALAQNLVLDRWIGRAREGKQVGLPAARWEDARALEMQWDFHGMQARLVEAVDAYRVAAAAIDGASGGTPWTAIDARDAAAQAATEIVRTAEIDGLGRACGAFELAFARAWQQDGRPLEARAPAERSQPLAQALGALDGLLMVRALAARYPVPPFGELPAGAQGVHGPDMVNGPGDWPARAERAERHAHVAAAHPAFVRFGDAARATRPNGETAFGPAEEAALRAAEIARLSLDGAYTAYLRACDTGHRSPAGGTPLLDDLETRRHPDLFMPPTPEALRQALDAAQAHVTEGDSLLDAAMPRLQEALRRLEPLRSEASFAALHENGLALLSGLRGDRQPSPEAGGAAAVPVSPAAAFASATAGYSPFATQVPPDVRAVTVAPDYLYAEEVTDPWYPAVADHREQQARLFVLEGPGGTALARFGVRRALRRGRGCPPHSFAIAAASMYANSHWCPSGSSNPCPYMKPRSCTGIGALPPAASALRTNSSTSARLSQARQTRTSVHSRASATGFLVKVWKNFSCSSIAKIVSLTTTHSAFSSLNWGLKLKPSAA